MKPIASLATLVAVLSLLLLQGCYALTGCPGSPECDPNYVADAADGGSQGDASSSPETKVGNDTTKADTAVDPCPPEFKARIDGVNKWTCNKNLECPLVLVKLNGGKYCAVQCPGKFTAKVPDKVKFVSETELVYDVFSQPQSCILQAN